MSAPKKALGQHWLHDPTTLETICRDAAVEQGDVVLEIGPGTGTLTDKLLKAGAKITAIEYDQELVTKLKSKYASNLGTEILIQEGDIRTYDFDAMPDPYKIVANIPYYLTSYLLRRLTDEKIHKPSVAVLLVQREVAERVAAEPAKMSLMAVLTQYYYKVSLGLIVPAKLFTPPPKVDSQILILHLREQPFFDVDTKQFLRLVKAGFAQRRKTLVNNLSGGLQIDRTEVSALLEKSGTPLLARAQNLSFEEWHNIYENFTPLLH